VTGKEKKISTLDLVQAQTPQKGSEYRYRRKKIGKLTPERREGWGNERGVGEKRGIHLRGLKDFLREAMEKGKGVAWNSRHP